MQDPDLLGGSWKIACMGVLMIALGGALLGVAPQRVITVVSADSWLIVTRHTGALPFTLQYAVYLVDPVSENVVSGHRRQP